MKPISTCFVFVCQGGALEPKAALLAASLRYRWGDGPQLVAAIPGPADLWPPPSGRTLEFLAELGVRTVAISNPIGADYPIGNKLACLNIETTAERQVFLDSDILCMRAPHPEEFPSAPFAAKPADLATYGADLDAWSQVYGAFGLPVPFRRVAATVSGQLMPPYFNAGMIAVDSRLGFGPVWIETCQRIDADPSISNKRPWLDQIGLPVALARLGADFQALGESFNYPAHIKPLPADLPLFCHYHDPSVLAREARAKAQVQALCRHYPGLAAILGADPAWAALLAPPKLEHRRRPWWRSEAPTLDTPPELIITGMPRSGTSFLCKILHKAEDVVVINEPAGVFGPLMHEDPPWGLARLYGELRRDILAGVPVENKLKDGEVTEDTVHGDHRTPYLPKVGRPDFLLATKNTLSYLSRIPDLKRVLPAARIVTCVRHPFDAIASWKTSFGHLAAAAVRDFPVGHPDDPGLAAWQRRRLEEIAAQDNAALRRALLWRYLAECLLQARDSVRLVRYEDMVREPGRVVRDVLGDFDGGFARTLPVLPGSSPRFERRAALDAEDYAAIAGVCATVAGEFGYSCVGGEDVGSAGVGTANLSRSGAPA